MAHLDLREERALEHSETGSIFLRTMPFPRLKPASNGGC